MNSQFFSTLPNALKEAQAFLEGHQNTKNNFDRVVNLVDGFESPSGMELLATVHWVVKKEDAKSIEKVINKVHSWSRRKKRFTRDQLEIAFDTLKKKSWL